MATKFVSLFLAEIELSGTIMFCCAGHPPALLVRASGEVERLAAGGLPLGPFPNARYTADLTRIDAGDTLVIYTDGITEAHGTGEAEFGIDRLEELVLKIRKFEPEAIVDRIFDEVVRFSGSATLHDDQTVLVVQRRWEDADE